MPPRHRSVFSVALAAAAAWPSLATAGGKVLFVADLQAEARPVDDSIRSHLSSSGLTVSVIDQDTPAPDLGGFDVILVSATVRPHGIGMPYRDAAVPVVTWQPAVLEDLRMTGRVQDVDYGNELKRPGSLFFFLVNSPHPLAAGLANGLWTVFTDTQKTLSWGRPGLGATVIATLPGEPRKAALFAYEKGALMDGDFEAPARRVMLFINRTGFKDLDPNGIRLFDAAVAWAMAAGNRPAAAPASGPEWRRKLLFVKNTQLAPIFLAADTNAEKRLQSEGFAITEASAEDCVAKAPGQEIVVVSSTVEARDVGPKFRDTALPVVTWEGYLLNHMRMTGKLQDLEFGCDVKESVTCFWMSNAPHPIAAGLPNGWLWPYKSPSRIKKVDWGTPGPGATVIATLPGEPQKAGIFCYEKGALMDGEFPAPGRRVMLFLHSESFDQLNDAGLKIFDAAIHWAAAQP